MNRRKVVTLCGSVRFWDKIQELYEKLELENKYAVIGITPHVMNRNFTEDEEDLLDELHRIKIDLADAICISECLKYNYSILQDKNKMNYK